MIRSLRGRRRRPPEATVRYPWARTCGSFDAAVRVNCQAVAAGRARVRGAAKRLRAVCGTLGCTPVSPRSDGRDRTDAARAVGDARRCNDCSRFIAAVGPPRCTRCQKARTLESATPTFTELQTDESADAPNLHVVDVAAPDPRSHLSDVHFPDRTSDPRRPRLPPATWPARGSANYVVIPRPSQLHPLRSELKPSGVISPRLRLATPSVDSRRPLRWRYLLGSLMVGAGLSAGVIIAIAGQLVRL